MTSLFYLTAFIAVLASASHGLAPGELDLLDIVLVASVDGKFHLLNRTSGHALWSMSSSPSMTSLSAPSPLAPLVRTPHLDYDTDVTDESMVKELYVVEPQSGDIYLIATPTSPLQRFPFSVSEIVDMSPFSFEGAEDRRIFVGRKERSRLSIELMTGKIKTTYNSECARNQAENDGTEEIDSCELDQSKAPISTPTEVYISRTDYYLSIYTRPHNRDPALKPPIQRLLFSTYGPDDNDDHVQGVYGRTKDDIYVESLPYGDVMSFKVKPTGDDLYPNKNSQLLWSRTFDAPIVAVLDVLRKSTSHSCTALVLLQPRRQLKEILPDPINVSHNYAFVGMVMQTGSLFAMSLARFPLITFRSPERYANSRPIYTSGPEIMDTGELPAVVDAIIRARNHEELMKAWNRDECHGTGTYTDRRCLVGMRPVEDGDGDRRL